uniref:Uncharacterized protein n=1 Tax=viral metagenome TaxID=1070528 RepID=A0A6M3IH95_9ZZZZ
MIEHHEEAYRDYATIILSNADRTLDAVATSSVNLLGYKLRIAYGYVTGNAVAEPNGDNNTKEYAETADLWVKTQQMVTAEGELTCQLYCEGMWNYMREQRVMAWIGAMTIVDPDMVQADPDAAFSSTFEKTHSVYELLRSTIEDAIGFSLDNFTGTQDGIINDFYPVMSVEEMPTAAVFIREKLLALTKCFLRPKANTTFELVYPQSTDPVDETYNSDSAYYFYSYAEKLNLLIPNRIVTFCNDPDDNYTKNGVWGDGTVMIGDSSRGVPYSGNYVEVLEAELAATITSQIDADNRADALLIRYQAEDLAGYLIIPHDARLELYDKVEVNDNRT